MGVQRLAMWFLSAAWLPLLLFVAPRCQELKSMMQPSPQKHKDALAESSDVDDAELQEEIQALEAELEGDCEDCNASVLGALLLR